MNGICACFQGRLGGDADLRTVKQDLQLCSFSLAVDDNRDETQWIKVTIFGDKAKEYSELCKGDEVYCEGALRLNHWQGKDGGARAGLNVSAWRVEVLGKIGRQSTKPKRTAKEAKDDEPYFDDPIPF
ncbi:MAG: single-stranded DNA-binding protein [Gammaproteobacteria bacterium]